VNATGFLAGRRRIPIPKASVAGTASSASSMTGDEKVTLRV
jgi:hypothetical protein